MIFAGFWIAWIVVLYGAAYWSVGYLVGRYIPPGPPHDSWDEDFRSFAHASWGVWALIWPLTLALLVPVALGYVAYKGLSYMGRGHELGSARRNQLALQKEGRANE